MSLRTYFDTGLRTTIIFALLGVVVGFLSFLQNSSIIAFLIMVVVAVIFTSLLKRLLKVKEDWKWWFSNGLIVYIFLWLITWTIFYNVIIK